jgi:hypothetical protein
MIQVTMGDQDSVQPLKADATAQDLALSSLTAVDHETALAVQDDLGGKPTVGRGGRSGGAKEQDLKHGSQPP